MATLDRPNIEYKTPVDLVRDVQRGVIRVPQFQRGFRWEASDVTKLFDSLYRGYPIGNLLLWRRSAPAQHLILGPIDVDAHQTESALWVVDGQQRITSIVGALMAADKTTDSRFRIYLNLDQGVFRSVGARQEPPVSWVPVNLLLDTVTLLRWMRANVDLLSESQISLADQAAKAIREYQIPTYVVSSTDESALIEIFTRMNDTGKPLSKAESFQALHSGIAGHEPTDLSGISRVTADQGFGAISDRLALRCILAYRGGDIFRDDFHGEFSSDAERVSVFREVAELLREAISFLQGEVGIPNFRLLPYSHVVPVLVRFFRVHAEPSERVAVLLRRWIWRNAVAGTRARGISVVDVRHQVLAAETGKPIDAARQLLKLIPPISSFEADISAVHAKHAMTKLNVLGLLSADPRDLRTGEPIDIRTILEAGSPVRPIVVDRTIPYVETMANRIVAAAGAARLIQHSISEAAVDILASHLITEDARELLAGRQYADFLAARAEAVSVAVKSHVDRMAEWGARDSQSISDIVRSVA